ncbi:tyrosine--tRNA ligase [Patescibacteria group bacterium]|nr:tyrosine--tRNA ligase [Patescibacteria group bacterium]
MANSTNINHLLEHNVDEIIDLASLTQKLNSSKPLRIKLGVDPTRPDLHLGHAVTLFKLKEFQELGHIIIFLIGDYTTRIGDPSGRSATRPALTEEEIEHNAQTYLDQVGKILNIDKCEIRRNSEWFSQMTFADIIKLLSQVTVAQILDREDFKNRLGNNIDLAMHEIIYPIMQGYDSIQLKADIELGGVDQKLNLLMGRHLMKKFDLPEQDIMVMPLLIGIDGVKKMSKSLDNYIGISESPDQQFGKVMSIPDNLIIDYWKLCTHISDDELTNIQKELSSNTNPRDIKIQLAKAIVAMYHDAGAADQAETNFINTFQKGETPPDIPTITIELIPTPIADLLINTALTTSKSEARRLIEQKGVKIDQQTITNPEAVITPMSGMVIQIGKRKFVRLG